MPLIRGGDTQERPPWEARLPLLRGRGAGATIGHSRNESNMEFKEAECCADSRCSLPSAERPKDRLHAVIDVHQLVPDRPRSRYGVIVAQAVRSKHAVPVTEEGARCRPVARAYGIEYLKDRYAERAARARQDDCRRTLTVQGQQD
jgi:hypothetical protein